MRAWPCSRASTLIAIRLISYVLFFEIGLNLARADMLLCNASYYGTLAAVRSLGRAGVGVLTVDPAFLAPGRYSRYSNRHLRCPPFEMTDEWVEWLLRLGRTGPRRAIYATSDAVSFALAKYRDELSAFFDLYQPSLDTIMCILDKSLLLQHAKAVGLDTPETWLPQSAEEAAGIVRAAGGTILMKPRSQLAVTNQIKGIVVDSATNDGRADYSSLLRQGAHDQNFARQYPDAMLPMLQRYHPEALTTVLSVSGFRDITGAHVVMRGAHKILQRPRQLGIGLCFEEAEVAPELAERVLRLCQRIGYYGVFELEFILCDGQPLLIDFNGRFYNQLAFDIARGLDLPGLVHAGATGRTEEVASLIATVPVGDQNRKFAFCNRVGLSVTLGLRRVLGAMSIEEAKRWRDWHKAHHGRIVDAVHDGGDPLPALIDVMQHFLQSIRHPRAFLRQTGLAK
jgi:D-aspartate ligase